MIEITDLTVAYGGVSVLERCSLRVPDGSHIALMGPSGCGKTTLLRVIMGLERPSGGSVRVDGRVSAVFQEPRLLPWLSAVDNVAIVREKSPDGAEKALRLLERAGLAGAERKYPRELSGGMQQRIAICRALYAQGNILLLDEPFKGLDDANRRAVSSLIGEMTAGKTLILVTHDLSDARSLTDRIFTYSQKTFSSET